MRSVNQKLNIAWVLPDDLLVDVLRLNRHANELGISGINFSRDGTIPHMTIAMGQLITESVLPEMVSSLQSMIVGSTWQFDVGASYWSTPGDYLFLPARSTCAADYLQFRRELSRMLLAYLRPSRFGSFDNPDHITVAKANQALTSSQRTALMGRGLEPSPVVLKDIGLFKVGRHGTCVERLA